MLVSLLCNQLELRGKADHVFVLRLLEVARLSSLLRGRGLGVAQLGLETKSLVDVSISLLLALLPLTDLLLDA